MASSLSSESGLSRDIGLDGGDGEGEMKDLDQFRAPMAAPESEC